MSAPGFDFEVVVRSGCVSIACSATDSEFELILFMAFNPKVATPKDGNDGTESRGEECLFNLSELS